MTPEDFNKELDKQQADADSSQNKDNELKAINKAGIKNVEATNAAADKITAGTQDIKGKVEVTNNGDLAKSDDMNNVMSSIRDLNLTTFMGTKGYHDMAENIAQVHNSLKGLQDQYEKNGLPDAANVLGGVVDKIGQLVKSVTGSKVTLDSKLQKTLDGLTKQIDSIDFNPTVNVNSPEPKVVTTPIDLKPVTEAISKLQSSYEKIGNKEKDPTDFSPVLQGLQSVQDAITNQRFPVPNYVLPFKDSTGKATQVQLDSSGNVPTSGGGSGGGGTQYAEGATTAPATGNVGLGRYSSTPPTLTTGALNAMAIDANANTIVVGNVASGSTDVGSPVKVGGVQNSTNPTLSNGQRGDFQLDSRGNLKVSLWAPNNTQATSVGTAADSASLTNSLRVDSITKVYNGTTEDLARSASAASNTTGTGLLGVGNLGYDGTNWQSIGAVKPATGGQAALLTGGTYAEQTGSASSATSLIAAFDASQYKWGSITLSGTWSGTVQIQVCNDNTNFVAIGVYNATATNSSTTGITANGSYAFPIQYRYVRVQVITYTSGTVVGTFESYTIPPSLGVLGVNASQSGTWTVGSNSATGSAVPANAFFLGVNNTAGNLAGVLGASDNSDGVTTTGSGTLLRTVAEGASYNNSTMDRNRNNTTVVVVAAGQTSTVTQTLTTYNASKLLLAVNIASGAGTVTVAINGVTSSGYTYPILTSTALTGVADNTLRVFPGATPSANTTANDMLPRLLSITYTVVGTIAFGSDANLSV